MTKQNTKIMQQNDANNADNIADPTTLSGVSASAQNGEKNAKTAEKSEKTIAKLPKTDKNLIHKNHRSRMKNSFLATGFEGFSDVQKLEFLLFFAIPQKDVNPIAHALLDEFGTIARVMMADYNDLIKVPGVGSHTAMLIKTCRALVDDCYLATPEIENIGKADVACKFCFNHLRHLDVENFLIVCLSDQNNVLYYKIVGTGTPSRVNVMISDIMKTAFSHKASKLLIAHNHPGGGELFSDADMRITHNIICSCLLNDIEPVDHILVTKVASLSLKELGPFDALKKQAIQKLNIIRKASSADIPYTISRDRTAECNAHLETKDFL